VAIDEEKPLMAQEIGEQELVRLMLGGKMLRRQRLRQALLAHILHERGEEESDSEAEGIEDEPESGTDERKLARLLIGSNIVRRRRLRALMLAHVLREKREAAEEDEGVSGEEGEESEGVSEHRLAKLLIGSGIARRRRLRALMLAHLLKEKREAAAEEEDDTGEEAGEGDDDSDHQLARLLIGSSIARRHRLRKALVAQALRGAD
jgi:hypothetical protein